ncbi:MAG TPA: glycosyltransferase [Thermoanaerobaculia bacterium]|nr:glycosyltransferase [Thermoanaerobaculia bacterium]
MAKILFAVFPVTGHINPGLPIARELVRRGHDVRWYTTPRFRAAVEATGARVVPYRRATAIDETRFDELVGRPKGGIRQLQWDVEKIFIDPTAAQYADIEEELRREPADVIVGDNASVVCALVREKFGIPFVAFGITALSLSSRDTAPFGMTLMPSSTPLGRLRNRLLYTINDDVIFRAARAAYNRVRAELGLPPYTRSTFDFPKDAALYLQGSAPSFEYPRSDMPANLRWIGASVPEPPANWQPPAWWPELDRWPVILVTQGTINNDYDQLIRPTIRALAAERALVIVTTGSKPAEAVGIDPLPINVRVERFIPYAQLMPKVDLLVTNGGYGTVQIALAHGVPVVAVGKTEEKPEIANRVTYSGAGIGMKVLVPREQHLRDAVRRVLRDGTYAARAERIAKEMAGLDAPSEAAELIEELVGRAEVAATA